MSEDVFIDNTQPRINEVFSFRDNEQTLLHTEPPDGWSMGCMLRSVQMPEGPRGRVDTPSYQGPPSQFAILTCERRDDGWAWLVLSPPSKQWLGAYMFDECGCDPDVWYYLTLEKE